MFRMESTFLKMSSLLGKKFNTVNANIGKPVKMTISTSLYQCNTDVTAMYKLDRHFQSMAWECIEIAVAVMIPKC